MGQGWLGMGHWVTDVSAVEAQAPGGWSDPGRQQTKSEIDVPAGNKRNLSYVHMNCSNESSTSHTPMHTCTHSHAQETMGEYQTMSWSQTPPCSELLPELPGSWRKKKKKKRAKKKQATMPR